MFEQVGNKSLLGESLEALTYLIKANPVSAFFYGGAIPFGALWIAHNSVRTAFALQAYCVTTLVFLDDPFRTEKENVKKWWFWKAMLGGGALVHPFVLAGIWSLDAGHPAVAARAIELFSIAAVAAALEVIILGLIVDRRRPTEQRR